MSQRTLEGTIRTFLDTIGYREWCSHVQEVIAIETLSTGRKRETQLGTLNFEYLAFAIDYLGKNPSKQEKIDVSS